jgi:enamine deaminase RidA (YjgF/YER057c/UK114 family)
MAVTRQDSAAAVEPVESVERRLHQLGLELPTPPNPIGRFAYGVEHAGVLYVSGTYGTRSDGRGNDSLPWRGKVGADLTIDEGYQSARLMALNLLAMAKAVLCDLDRIDRVLQLQGFVNGAPGFKHASRVLNGASDLLVEVFGEDRGAHARAALYQHELAADAPVAGQLLLAVRPSE